MAEQLTTYFETILSPLVSAYRKGYSCQHVILRLTELWRKALDDNNYVGTIAMDLSKAFDCMPHGLLIAKLHSYGVSSKACLFLAATKQLYEWFSPSVRPSVRPSVCLSVRPSVCHTFLTMFPSSYHHEIFRSYYQWQKWRPCKRSRSEVKGQGHRGHDPNFRFRTVTPVWIHIWWWNDTYSLMLLRRGALLFFKVIRQISGSHGAKIAEFDPDWAFPDCNSSLNSPMAMKCCTKLEVA